MHEAKLVDTDTGSARDFLVPSGECIALVEGEGRPMRQWDYLHCPPGTPEATIHTR